MVGMQCVWLLQRLSLVQQEEVAEGKEGETSGPVLPSASNSFSMAMVFPFEGYVVGTLL